MDSVAPDTPPNSPPPQPKSPAKPKPPGGTVQTPKPIAKNLDELKSEYAKAPAPAPLPAKPKGRPRKQPAKPKPKPPSPPVQVKQEPVRPPPVRIDVTEDELSSSSSESDFVPRESPPGYEPPAEGPSTLTKLMLVAGAFAGAFLLGKNLVKPAVSVHANLDAKSEGVPSAGSARLSPPGTEPIDRHEAAAGPISKAEINQAAQRRPLQGAALNGGSTAAST
jgi:hypothetical protein